MALAQPSTATDTDIQSTPAKPTEKRRKPRKPPPAVLIAQVLATATTASHKNFVSLVFNPLSSVTHSIENGLAHLKVVLPLKGGEIHTLDLSFLLPFPNIADALADATLVACQNVAKTTREDYVKALVKFVRFLTDSNYYQIELSECQRAVWLGFAKSLDKEQPNGVTLNQPSRAVNYIRMKRLFAVLSKHPKWKGIIIPLLPEIPRDPWPGYKRRNTPAQPIPDDVFESILRAAEEEVVAQQHRLTKSAHLLEEGRKRNLLNPDGWKEDYAQLLAHLHSTQDREIVTKGALKDAGVSKLLVKRFSEIIAHLFPTQRDLTPFLLLITAATAYNPDAARSLSRTDIVRRTSESGKKIIIFLGRKRRGQRHLTPQPRSFDGETRPGELSLAAILQSLEELSDRVLPFVQLPEHKNRLFLFRNHLNKYSSYYMENEDGKLPTSNRNLKVFADDHKLPYFTLEQFRTTVMNQEMQRTGDLRAGQAVGLQKSIRIVATHYTSGETRKKFQEQVGEIYHLRNRYIKTKGKIDPRKLSLHQDKASATPGFDCLDVMNSPRLGQKLGRICDGYGECPGCENVIPNPGRVENVVMWLALRQAIYRSQTTLSPETWIAKWAPILAELEALISQVEPEIIKKASQIPITLPPVG